MFKVLAAKNEFSGELKNFELGGDDLIIRFALAGMETIECTFPKVPTILKDSIGRMGLEKLKNGILDLNVGKISFENLESGGQSVTDGKKMIKDARPRLKLGSGSLVG